VCVCVAATEMGLTAAEANLLRAEVRSYFFGKLKIDPASMVTIRPSESEGKHA